MGEFLVFAIGFVMLALGGLLIAVLVDYLKGKF
nr:MAG TPA: transmembrane protein [Caudoviricetes sp.]